VTSENFDPARSSSSSMEGFIMVSWREAMVARTSVRPVDQPTRLPAGPLEG
jgi:hypothetical protein